MEQEQAEEALKNVKKVPHHMGHSRNPSAASAISFCSVISEPISEVNEKEYGKLLHTILNDLNFEIILVIKIIRKWFSMPSFIFIFVIIQNFLKILV